jgi:hypothetical protein
MFADKSTTPDEAALSQALGSSFKRWTELKDRIVKQYDLPVVTWMWGGKKGGWYLKLANKKRSALFMGPDEGHFRAALLFNEKAVEAARQSDLPNEIIDLIANAPKYPEGRAVRLKVKTIADARLVEKIVAVKMAS